MGYTFTVSSKLHGFVHELKFDIEAFQHVRIPRVNSLQRLATKAQVLRLTLF